jgi:hypothetical protein
MKNATPIPARARTTPDRMAQDMARSPSRLKARRTPTAKVASHTTTIDTAMTPHSAALRGVETLKWLVVSAATAPTITTISSTSPTAATVPAHHANLRPRVSRLVSHERVMA